ncbi:cell envelope integrity protein TolA [Desulfoplanes formicivorans]|nr:cell envelope integrity protein TolA [Desulfoplanes formicivorans]
MGSSLHVDLGKRVYTVDLVTLPAPAPAVASRKTAPVRKKTASKPSKSKAVPALPSKSRPKPKAKPVKKISPKKTQAPQRVARKKPAPPKKTESSRQIIAQALKGVQGEVSQKTRKEQQDLARELAGLRKSVDQDNRATGGKGTTSQESGLVQVYGRIAETAIKEHWRFPRVGGSNLAARIEVRIDPGGKVLGTRVLVSSGRTDFDGSALRAIHEAEPLPEPPSRDIKRLIITFNLSELQE